MEGVHISRLSTALFSWMVLATVRPVCECTGYRCNFAKRWGQWVLDCTGSDREEPPLSPGRTSRKQRAGL